MTNLNPGYTFSIDFANGSKSYTVVTSYDTLTGKYYELIDNESKGPVIFRASILDRYIYVTRFFNKPSNKN